MRLIRPKPHDLRVKALFATVGSFVIQLTGHVCARSLGWQKSHK